jgi:uncharacterized membrane protein/predicted DsbA family dithiol-disulfide isomerase
MRSERMLGGVALAASLAFAALGVGASAMLLVDYLRPTPVFCAEGGGCAALQNTPIAHPAGVPLPALGLFGFAVLAVVAIFPGRGARVTQAALAAAAGVAGTALLVAQVALGHFCPYCAVADASGLASALVAGWRLTRAANAPSPAAVAIAGAGALVAAAAVPLVVGLRAPTGVPPVIRAELRATPQGAVTVVDFVDFECPFCRMTHAELEPLLEAHKDRVRLVRRQVPLHIHPHALDAARAACCGERLGRGDAMANALFTAPVEQLTREGCERIAQSVGLAVDPYRACVADPSTDAHIQADQAVFKDAGGYALPTIWINEQQMVGAQPREVLQAALDAALARAGS